MMEFYEMDGQLTLLDPEEWEDIPARSSPKRNGPSTEELVSTGFLLLDLTPGHCDLLGEPYWLLRSPWRDDGPCLNTGVAPRQPNRASLSGILEPKPDAKYYLSKTACIGILARKHDGPQIIVKVEAEDGTDPGQRGKTCRKAVYAV